MSTPRTPRAALLRLSFRPRRGDRRGAVRVAVASKRNGGLRPDLSRAQPLAPFAMNSYWRPSGGDVARRGADLGLGEGCAHLHDSDGALEPSPGGRETRRLRPPVPARLFGARGERVGWDAATMSSRRRRERRRAKSALRGGRDELGNVSRESWAPGAIWVSYSASATAALSSLSPKNARRSVVSGSRSGDVTPNVLSRGRTAGWWLRRRRRHVARRSSSRRRFRPPVTSRMNATPDRALLALNDMPETDARRVGAERCGHRAPASRGVDGAAQTRGRPVRAKVGVGHQQVKPVRRNFGGVG